MVPLLLVLPGPMPAHGPEALSCSAQMVRIPGGSYRIGAGAQLPEEQPAGADRANTLQGPFPISDRAEAGLAGTAPVGSFAPTAYGLFDMTGHVWEWTRDFQGMGHGAQAERGPAPSTSSRSGWTGPSCRRRRSAVWRRPCAPRPPASERGLAPDPAPGATSPPFPLPRRPPSRSTADRPRPMKDLRRSVVTLPALQICRKTSS